MKRIVIADDHAIFRSGLRVLLDAHESDCEIIEAGNLQTMLNVLNGCSEQDISVIILDLQMPGMDHHLGIAKVRNRFRQTPILVLSASEDAEDVYKSLSLGASGYIAKSAPMEKLLAAIKTVKAGGVAVPIEILSGMPQGAAIDAISVAPSDTGFRERLFRLTPRQMEVLEMVAAGYANKDIAFRLRMNEGTVKTHVSAIMRQLDARNRVQMIRNAQKAGILSIAGEASRKPRTTVTS